MSWFALIFFPLCNELAKRKKILFLCNRVHLYAGWILNIYSVDFDFDRFPDEKNKIKTKFAKTIPTDFSKLKQNIFEPQSDITNSQNLFIFAEHSISGTIFFVSVVGYLWSAREQSIIHLTCDLVSYFAQQFERNCSKN